MLLDRQPKNPGFIFSVFQRDLDTTENEITHNYTKDTLKLMGVSFKEVIGQYTYDNGEIGKELSFYVETNNQIDEQSLYDFVKTQCANANQESFLGLSSNRQATLYPTKGEAQGIGAFTLVSEVEAFKAPAFTYCPALESYYICK